MSGQITPHQVALACGTGGAYVDVTSYVEFGEGLTYTYGRPDQFSDPTPGTFTFTLNNSDGRFTPGNTASPLVTKVTEGMGVAWLLGTRLVHASILSVSIPSDEATWNQIVVTCDDMLGDAGRHQLTSIADGLTSIYNPPLWWRLDEPSDATAGMEVNGALLGSFVPSSSKATTTTTVATFGQAQHPALPGTAVMLTASPGETNRIGTTAGNTVLKTTIGYPIPTDTTKTYVFGAWCFWVYPGSTTTFAVTPYWAVGPGYRDAMKIIVTPTSIGVQGGVSGISTHTYTAAESTVPHCVSMNSTISWSGTYWQHAVYLYLDGVNVGATYFLSSSALGSQVPTAMLTAGTAMQPLEVAFTVTNPSGAVAPVTATVQRVVFIPNVYISLEQNALYATEDERRAVLDTLATDLSSAAYNGRPSLSTAPIGYPDVSQRSVLDVYNDIVRTEQGHLFCTTTGTLTTPVALPSGALSYLQGAAPVEQIQVRDRDRPTAVKAAFHATNEADGIPTFLRDITNVAASVEVNGPDENATVADPTITGRYVTSGLSETVLFTNLGDLRMWGQDRLNRGKNIGIRIDTVTVDAFTTPTDRAADLLSFVPGDRLQVTGLPSAVLGFAAWDGWVIGAAESHGIGRHQFTYRLQPTLAAPGLTDTALTGNGGDIVLASSVTATQTTLTVTSTSGDTFSTDTPYDCTLGTAGEQVTVTAVSGNTLTVVRGVNGSTAIAHTTAALLEVTAAAILAY